MLKNIEDYQINLQSDGELLLNIEQKLVGLKINNFAELSDFFIQHKISSLTDLHEYVRSKKCDLELTLLLGQLLVRVQQIKHGTLSKFYSSVQVGHYLVDLFNGESQEQLLAIYLDTKNRVLAQKVIFKGSLNKSVAHPREILEPAIRFHSAAIIIAHNHPSGDTAPSKEDVDFSTKLRDACSIIGIECLDHFIVGEGTYLSLREAALI
ncbi:MULTISPECIES: RadC family protein [Amylolactobacillus]|nr:MULTISPECIES: DNA repair protein RadC [Amylolactobacillus]APT19090.1 hypothetical protein LA20533_07450 [Amylolactobacillus amylophilus DSM 20533 = JCM 1125]GED79574.1 DNA repair protein RadC [Amylolactobacillus amylophilus]